MLVTTVDGSVRMRGRHIDLGIPATGEVRYRVESLWCGGTITVEHAQAPDAATQSGRVVLEVSDGRGGYDELEITTPRTLEVDEDGKVKLTLSEYVQAGNALSGVGAKLLEFEGRLAALEHPLAVYDGCDAAVPPKQHGCAYGRGNPDSAMEGSRGPLPTYPAGEE